ncbi:MAG: penicillin-binding transpeptidase domain-containing protein [Lachnospiraceae bacterium]|nr:penicillin-binding protein [Lachnospiraceae bacterium]MDD7050703.1 penicillin-binding transpeptidase domain-containing protein [Lachnospiraceae bacterium]MDY4096140.1 penicillin-binding transpeptidase domain-containing protein [Lachnospiraceae bacterium]
MFRNIKRPSISMENGRLIILAVIFLALAGVQTYRIFDLQIVNGAQALEDFTLKIQKERSIPSTRGNIYDRNGKVLAHNELAYNVTIEDVYESGSKKNEKLNETILKLIHLIEQSGDEIDSDFSIIIDEDGNYAYTVTDTKLRRFRADVYGYADPGDMSYQEETSTAEEMMEYLAGYSRYGVGKSSDPANPRDSFILGEGYTKKEILQVVTIRYAMSANSYQKFIPTNVATDVNTHTVANILENIDELPGAAIEEDTIRVYEDSIYFAHILGYIGKISKEELDTLDTQVQTPEGADIQEYSLTDMVGKSGIEQSMESYLRGINGSETIYVDNVGKVIETRDRIEPKAGNNLYLTIDADLQVAIYNILEQKLAGILVTKIINSKTYVIPEYPSASSLYIPIDDVYFALIDNSVIDVAHFNQKEAKENEQAIYQAFLTKQDRIFTRLQEELYDRNTIYKELETEYQIYQSYIVTMLTDNGVIISDAVNTEDATYKAWKTEETISLGEFLTYCISQNWIDVSKINLSSKYADSEEIFSALTQYIFERLENNTTFAKKIYKYMIKNNDITPKQICTVLLEQEVVSITEEEKYRFLSGQISAYNFMLFLIENLYITPAQLALDPCSASVVVTNTDGEVLALVSYPSYDNNRLANSIDAKYFAQLQSDLTRPMWNSATQQRTVPGSTYKMVSATAALEEGIVTTTSNILCRGIFDRFTTDRYKCWIYPGAHGNLNVVGGIANSCNCFFYEVGYQLGVTGDTYNSDVGVDKLYKYADMFGLSDKSGVEIDEASPVVSNDYSVLSAIGQGKNSFTTVGLARYVTTIANGGTCYDLSLIDKAVDSNSNLLKDFTPNVRNRMELSPSTWNSIWQGMRQVVLKRSDFSNLGVSVAGKTGTAEESRKRANHALFVSYAPFESPEITVTTRIANGYTSNYAANLTRDIYQYYFGLQEEDELLSGTANVPDVSAAGGD